MNRADRRARARKNNAHIKTVSKAYGPMLEELDLAAMTNHERPPGLQRAWRSNRFLVQQFAPDSLHAGMVECRLSVNFIAVQASGKSWEDGITWEQLQALKTQAGYGALDAVEVFPRDGDVVNISAMRHLWVLKGLLPFAWRRAP